MLNVTWGAFGVDPIKEAGQLRAQIEASNGKASSLVDGLSEAATTLVREKLESLGRERRLLEIKLAELEAKSPSIGIDPQEVVAELRTYLGRLRHVRESESLERQKRFLRGMISRIEMNPQGGQAQVCWRLVPALRGGSAR